MSLTCLNSGTKISSWIAMSRRCSRSQNDSDSCRVRNVLLQHRVPALEWEFSRRESLHSGVHVFAFGVEQTDLGLTDAKDPCQG